MSEKFHFSLTLFSTDCDFIAKAVGAGVDEIMVDWEHTGKTARQVNFDTEVNNQTTVDLQRVRACTPITVICRLNAVGASTTAEIEQAVESGANEIMLPMVRKTAEVELVLDRVRERCGVGILVETNEVIECLPDMAKLPLSRVYVGLNDLAIERRTPSIFTAIMDGTVEHIRSFFEAPFGFGGLTLPQFGNPIPCRLLIAEMARLNCTFSFLRRSFMRDTKGRDLAIEVPRILQALAKSWQRPAELIQRDRDELIQTIALQST
jgi:hypothetical protein